MKNIKLTVLCIHRSSLLKLVVSTNSRPTGDVRLTKVTIFMINHNVFDL